jgi:hypothetical protein
MPFTDERHITNTLVSVTLPKENAYKLISLFMTADEVTGKKAVRSPTKLNGTLAESALVTGVEDDCGSSKYAVVMIVCHCAKSVVSTLLEPTLTPTSEGYYLSFLTRELGSLKAAKSFIISDDGCETSEIASYDRKERCFRYSEVSKSDLKGILGKGFVEDHT